MISKAPPGVDMSEEAIDRRFRALSELYQFATNVKDVKWVGKAKDLARQAEGDRGSSARETARADGGGKNRRSSGTGS